MTWTTTARFTPAASIAAASFSPTCSFQPQRVVLIWGNGAAACKAAAELLSGGCAAQLGNTRLKLVAALRHCALAAIAKGRSPSLDETCS